MLTNVEMPSWTVVSGLAAFIFWLCPDISPKIAQLVFLRNSIHFSFFNKRFFIWNCGRFILNHIICPPYVLSYCEMFGDNADTAWRFQRWLIGW